MTKLPMRVLVSGFEEFGEHRVNPSRLLVEELNSRSKHVAGFHGVDLRCVVLPVEFEASFLRLLQLLIASEIETGLPDVVLSFGLAANRRTIDFERFAMNWRDDLTGADCSAGGPIDSQEPLALPSTLPIGELAAAARALPCAFGCEIGVSSSAGTYVCNDLFFRLQSRFRRTPMRTGFIHLPPLQSEQCAGPTLDQLVQFVSLTLGVLSRSR